MPPEPRADPPPGGNGPVGGDPPRSPQPGPRRPWWRKLAPPFVVLLALVAGAVYYARSEDALQRFYVPFASRLLDADIEARGLNHAFPLSLGLNRLEVFHRPTGATVEIDALETKWDPASLFGEALPRLMLVHASSLSLTLPLESGEEDDTAARRAAGIRQTPWIPVRIDRADIAALELNLTQEDRAWFSATLHSLILSDLNPDAPAQLSTRLDVRFAPPASGRVFHAGGDFDAALRQHEDGRALAWEIDWPVDVGESGPAPTDPAPIDFSVIQRLEGSLSPASESEHALQATASHAGQEAGALSTRIRIGAPSGEARRSILLEANGGGLQPVLINPALAVFGPESLSTGSLDGRLHLKLESGRTEIDSDLKGKNLRLAANNDHGETPPVSINLAQTALFHHEQRLLKIERTSLNVRERGQSRIQARLTAPFEFQFDDDATTGSPESVTGKAIPKAAPAWPLLPQASSPARLELSIDRIEIDRLKPWSAVWGSDLLQRAVGGTLSAKLTAELAATARSVSVQGNADVRDLMWENPEDGSTLGPLSMLTEMETLSPDLSRFTLRRFSADIQGSGLHLASIDAGGSFNRKDGAVAGRLEVALPDLPVTLNELGLLREDSPAALQAGRAFLEISADRPSRDDWMQLEGSAEIVQATLAVEANRLVRSAKAAFNGHIPPSEPRVEAVALNVDVSDGNDAPAGTINVEGYWPTAFEAREETAAAPARNDSPLPASPVAGKLGIRARGFDLKPWFELFGLRLEGPESTAWPASANLTLTVDPFGEIFTLEGEERLGPLTGPPATPAEDDPEPSASPPEPQE